MGDWQDLFGLSISPAEIVLRGTVMFWFLFAIFRFVLRRDVGNVGISDFLFVVIVADASQNAMTGESRTVMDGMLLVATLVAWNFLLDYLSYRVPLIRHLADPPSVLLVKNGRMLTRNGRYAAAVRDLPPPQGESERRGSAPADSCSRTNASGAADGAGGTTGAPFTAAAVALPSSAIAAVAGARMPFCTSDAAAIMLTAGA